jgi:DNA topoisomerase-1
MPKKESVRSQVVKPVKKSAEKSAKKKSADPADRVDRDDLVDLVDGDMDCDVDNQDNDDKTVGTKKSNNKELVEKTRVMTSGNNMMTRSIGGGRGSYILVIVESPGKIKKLESILGKGYMVVASFGHIMDLHQKKMSIDFDNNFEPEYHVITGAKKFQDKTKVVKDLIKKAQNASKVIIASDDDREGEMIGWSYKVVLGLNDSDYERITFNSITKDEIKKAIANPGKLDMLKVDSQKTRRILDRIVGFKISPSLSQMMGMHNLSAGRVQSIVVKLICEKEQEITKFLQGDNASFFRIVGNMITENQKIEMKCELMTDRKNNLSVDLLDEDDQPEEDQDEDQDQDQKNSRMKKAVIDSYKNAEKIMKNISESVFKISNTEMRKSKRHPQPPYTTSTAQQDASTKLGFNVKRTMACLQKLYEAGHTTYLRTDSTNLSADALTQCTKYVKEHYGDDYHNHKIYTNKKGNTQEAHEAIRPVDVSKQTVPINGKIGVDEQRVYQLVWKRTVASQMKPAEVDVHTVDIEISKEKDYFFRTSIDDITFSGFLAVYGIGVHGQDFNKIDPKCKILIPQKKEKVLAKDVRCSEDYKKPPMRYSEAGLVKKMDPKNLNIGRPATYAEVINTVQARKYVELKDVGGSEKKSRTITWIPEKGQGKIAVEEKTVHLGREKKKFCPTPLGMEVNTILCKNFPELMEYKFTSNMETQLDEIAEGDLGWVDCMTEFWGKLKPLLDNLDGEKKMERLLGSHPETGYPITASMGRHGPMLTMARSKKKTDRAIAPIKSPQTIETITLQQAVEILKYPKILGVHEKKNVELKTGSYGFYVTCGKEGANIPAGVDPDDIDLAIALKYLDDKKNQMQEKHSKYLYYHKNGNLEYIINTGKYGKYLMIKDLTKKNDKPLFLHFPADEDVEDITFERVKEIADEAKKTKYQKKKANPTDEKPKESKNKSDPVDLPAKKIVDKKTPKRTVDKKPVGKSTVGKTTVGKSTVGKTTVGKTTVGKSTVGMKKMF